MAPKNEIETEFEHLKEELIMRFKLIVLLALATSLLTGCGYNQIQINDEQVNAAWSDVLNQYKRRADLIPNLVNTVSGAANFEKSTLAEITEARASVGRVQLPAGGAPTDPAKFAEFEKAQGQLGGALSRLLVVAERYPNLTATAGFRDLQAQLEGTENRISVERGNFNTAVQAYNVAQKSFPAVIFAGMFGHNVRPYFTATAGADTPPPVKFDFGAKKSP